MTQFPQITISPVGYVSSLLTTKFTMPRQGNLITELYAQIKLVAPYNTPQVVEELEGFSHLWLIGRFHVNAASKPQLRVRPPRLGGNQRVGVFASRSPFRPNFLSLSLVKLERVVIDPKTNEVSLIISGCDLIDQTPIIDIKPYIDFADSPWEGETIRHGYVTPPPAPNTTPHFNPINLAPDAQEVAQILELPQVPHTVWYVAMEQLQGLAKSTLDLENIYPLIGGNSVNQKIAYLGKILTKLLALNPQPAYKRSDYLEMGMEYAGLEVQWRVEILDPAHDLWNQYAEVSFNILTESEEGIDPLEAIFKQHLEPDSLDWQLFTYKHTKQAQATPLQLITITKITPISEIAAANSSSGRNAAGANASPSSSSTANAVSAFVDANSTAAAAVLESRFTVANSDLSVSSSSAATIESSTGSSLGSSSAAHVNDNLLIRLDEDLAVVQDRGEMITFSDDSRAYEELLAEIAKYDYDQYNAVTHSSKISQQKNDPTETSAASIIKDSNVSNSIKSSVTKLDNADAVTNKELLGVSLQEQYSSQKRTVANPISSKQGLTTPSAHLAAETALNRNLALALSQTTLQNSSNATSKPERKEGEVYNHLEKQARNFRDDFTYDDIANFNNELAVALESEYIEEVVQAMQEQLDKVAEYQGARIEEHQATRLAQQQAALAKAKLNAKPRSYAGLDEEVFHGKELNAAELDKNDLGVKEVNARKLAVQETNIVEDTEQKVAVQDINFPSLTASAALTASAVLTASLDSTEVSSVRTAVTVTSVNPEESNFAATRQPAKADIFAKIEKAKERAKEKAAVKVTTTSGKGKKDATVDVDGNYADSELSSQTTRVTKTTKTNKVVKTDKAVNTDKDVNLTKTDKAAKSTRTKAKSSRSKKGLATVDDAMPNEATPNQAAQALAQLEESFTKLLQGLKNVESFTKRLALDDVEDYKYNDSYSSDESDDDYEDDSYSSIDVANAVQLVLDGSLPDEAYDSSEEEEEYDFFFDDEEEEEIPPKKRRSKRVKND